VSEAELEEFNELIKYFGTITPRQALDALKEELRTQQQRDQYWRFKKGHKFRTAWAEEWPGGMWIAVRVGDGKQATNKRSSMSEAELEEFNELIKYYGTTITPRQALDALKEELRTQRERDPYWRFTQRHKFKTAWAEKWPGGHWIANRAGDGEQATGYRASMSEAELEEFNELLAYYGRSRQ